MGRKLRILHAPVNIAGQMGILARGQRELGYDAHSCSFYDGWAMQACDESLSLEKLDSRFSRFYKVSKFFLRSLKSYDIFHFHFGGTLLPNELDLPILKALGKKTVMHYWGNDVRQNSKAQANNRFTTPALENERLALDRIKKISKYIRTAIVPDYELYGYVHDYFDRVEMIRQAVDLREYTPAVPSKDSKRPVIVHAPTDRRIKGTEHVLEAISRMEKDHELEFVLIDKLPHHRAKKMYVKADIIIDQVLAGTHGVFAVEAMALGKPVICYIREDLRSTYPQELPIVSASPDNLYEELKALVENPELRHDLGQRGRVYAERYHDSLKIVNQLIELYESL